MHRTQVMLEDSQYMALRERARQRGKSMGALIRELLGQEETLGAREMVRESKGLYALEGFLRDGKATAIDHDAILYGKRK